MRRPLALALGAAVAGALALAGCGDDEKPVTLGLIIKRETNPFFVKIKDTAQDTAGDDNVKLLTAAGRSDIDNRTQVAAINRMTAAGAKGILITPADSSAIVPAIERARRDGVNVIALDTPTRPRSAVNALYATDNRKAGELIGRYARAKAAEQGLRPRIAMLDLAPGITSGQLRHDGFLDGFGIREGDPRIVGSVDTLGEAAPAEAGMKRLLAQDPKLNVVYTVNEQAASGAADALKAAGRSQDDVVLVSVDGGCDAVKDLVRPGVVDATAQQYPENMAR
jgi:fructose transport system substrate-binding protein